MNWSEVPVWISAPIVVGTFIVLVWLERLRPLRHEVEPKLRRNARNLAVAAVGAVALWLAERPVAMALASAGEAQDFGLLRLVSLPGWIEVALALLLLDYTLYVWHVLNHKIPFLWRFHVAHHVDLDLDASTAFRFHVGELTLSIAWRAAQIVIIGVSPFALSVWQTALLVSTLFHHSNVRLPVGFERWINHLVVTPRMHGIHHSVVREETNSNWSSGLTIWDRLHGTLRLNIAQAEITIGVPAYQKPEEVSLAATLAIPFKRQRPYWRFPTGARPGRGDVPEPADRLLA